MNEVLALIIAPYTSPRELCRPDGHGRFLRGVTCSSELCNRVIERNMKNIIWQQFWYQPRVAGTEGSSPRPGSIARADATDWCYGPMLW